MGDKNFNVGKFKYNITHFKMLCFLVILKENNISNPTFTMHNEVSIAHLFFFTYDVLKITYIIICASFPAKYPEVG